MIGRERLEKAKSFVRVLLPGYALLCDFDWQSNYFIRVPPNIGLHPGHQGC